ncbi:DUF3305 domain-containing protein [Limnohabitans sp. 63ED37-2]|uniref:DUF3305 domain-containing protein n=1 Tax=Limnohabitans sp. 63ED37-2 TaxID=1678128 RepID=UPI000706265F|nr:DUF3305 domain-containing protein [Limnohabitans sp. 63ED37-2]ALK89444.1 hypothetical protein L63ED372_02241 [Limnohabitans sp. 63ED37-2]
MSVHVVSEMAVLMRREAVLGAMARWQSHRWVLADVVPQEVGFGQAPRCLRQTDDEVLWLYPGWPLELFSDDAEGYWLNLTSPTPSFFVMWRLQEGRDGQEELAVPQALSLSYHDAGRWLDAQETVENVPASPEVVARLQAFTDAFYVPEVKRRQRPQSFQGLTDRFGQPASVSTTEKRKGGRQGP